MSATASPDEGIRTRMRAETEAARTVSEWEAGAKALALVDGAAHIGLFDALRTAVTEAELSALTGTESARVADVCIALHAHGVLEQAAGGWKVSEKFAPLLEVDALRSLTSLTRKALAESRTISTLAAGRNPCPLPAEDVMAIAVGDSVNPTSPMRRGMAHIADPFVAEAFSKGRYHLELGCGVGGNLLSVLATFSNLGGVGIDLDEHLLRVAKRRAEAMGIAHRVELRCLDAQELSDEAVFDTVVWSDTYFEAASRLGTLRAAFRALRPGGLLLVGGEANAGSTADAGSLAARLTALRRLFKQGLGIPLTTDAEMLSNLAATGFVFVRAVESPARRRLIAKRPA